MTKREAEQILDALRESITDPCIDFGPAYAGACQRRLVAIELMKKLIKELK